MSAIKPGSLCVIVNAPPMFAERANGQIVEAVRPARKHPGCWVIDAAWIRALVVSIGLRSDHLVVVEQSCLRPIDDPSSATNTYTTMVVHI